VQTRACGNIHFNRRRDHGDRLRSGNVSTEYRAVVVHRRESGLLRTTAWRNFSGAVSSRSVSTFGRIDELHSHTAGNVCSGAGTDIGDAVRRRYL
jgi:hypothetical protein